MLKISILSFCALLILLIANDNHAQNIGIFQNALGAKLNSKLNENGIVLEFLNEKFSQMFFISDEIMDQLQPEVSPVLDSYPKLGPGILKGNIMMHGLYSECVRIDYKFVERDRNFQGAFGRIFIDSKLRDYREDDACSEDIFKIGMFGIDVCVPKSCESADDILTLARLQRLNITQPICKAKSMVDQGRPVDYKTWIVLTLFSMIIFLSVAAAVYEYYFYNIHQKNIFTEILLAFSLYTNITDLLSTKDTNESEGIRSLHFIRFMSILWVIAGHMLFLVSYISINPLDVQDILKNFTSQFLTNAYFSVDTFFYMSGLLLGYIWFKQLQRNPSIASSPVAWAIFYAHRIIRLSPPYYMAIAFYTFVFRCILVRMPMILTDYPEHCEENWWINFLYLLNFVDHKNKCYIVAWYLATDLQIYLFAPLILIPLSMSLKKGWSMAIFLFLISTALNALTVMFFYFPPSPFPFGAQDERMRDDGLQQYELFIYGAPWIRCQVYIMGLMTGHFLIENKSFRINRVVNVLLWIFSLTTGIFLIVALKDWTSGEPMSLGVRVLYSAFSRPVWGIALSYIIVSSYYGYGGFLNDFMSWNIWIPLGRLSYCSYLIHFMVEFYVVGLFEGPITFSGVFHALIVLVIPVVVSTLFLALFWSALFEIPFIKWEKIVLQRLNQKFSRENRKEIAKVHHIAIFERATLNKSSVRRGSAHLSSKL